MCSGRRRNIFFNLKSEGRTTVNGAMTVLGDLASTSSEAELYIGGDLSVNGLLTTAASKLETHFCDGGDTSINGSFQLGNPHDALDGTELELRFEGVTEVFKNEDLISIGAAALKSLGGNLNIPVIGDNLNRDEVLTRSWRMLPSQ